jgi:protein-L-isoaspartate O-methyltransferase
VPAQLEEGSGHYSYEGSELDVFTLATNWKAYWASRVEQHVGSRVLEVGAGLGATARTLCKSQTKWIALEPDPALARRMRAEIDAGRLPAICEVRVGKLEDIDTSERFDTILYIDVLEHIQDDRGELERAAVRLEQGGCVVVIAPAHQYLYTAFDKAIGHFRRYDRGMIASLEPSGLKLSRFEYLDSVGFLASLGNRWLLKSSSPSASQIKLWDRLMVPLSRCLDPFLQHRFGKSVLAVWCKN